MLKMTEQSKDFLSNNLPEALNIDNLSDALDILYDWIDDNGFAPPDYYDYNDLGREAQRVYDDLLISNVENPENYLQPIK